MHAAATTATTATDLAAPVDAYVAGLRQRRAQLAADLEVLGRRQRRRRRKDADLHGDGPPKMESVCAFLGCVLDRATRVEAESRRGVLVLATAAAAKAKKSLGRGLARWLRPAASCEDRWLRPGSAYHVSVATSVCVRACF
jgi:type II secretory pathway component PulJ